MESELEISMNIQGNRGPDYLRKIRIKQDMMYGLNRLTGCCGANSLVPPRDN